VTASIVTITRDRGVGSLRQAVLDANATEGAAEIRLHAAVFSGAAADITRLPAGRSGSAMN
jgi:hypothetical protein